VSLLGAAVSFATGSAVELFYRRKVIDGTIPETGPVLVVANHPNALLDPVLVTNSTGRRVRMLAKAPLFSMPGISLLVKGLDCLPVYRSKDGADTSSNAETFRAVEEALVGGSCVLIFPEGISHDEPTVQPLKTGAARMAIGAWRRGAKDIVVVPVGLTYADKLRYRSTAAVDIGPPIVVGDFIAAEDSVDVDDRDAARRLTDAIFAGLLKETVNVQSWEDMRLLDAVDAIWRQRDPERVRRLKSLADGVTLLRAEAPDEFDAFRSRLSLWVDRVAALGLSPRDLGEEQLEAQERPARAASFVVRNILAAIVGLPIAVTGALFWAPPFWAVHLLWRLMGVERDTGATVKVLGSLVFFPLWWLTAIVALVVGVGGVGGIAAAVAVGAAAPAAGLMTRHFFRRRFFAVRQLLGVLLLAARGSLGKELRVERDALCAELDGFGARVEARQAAPTR
jgi:glycerol-3-phosphate O-acyltransferase/dihydroxyacetone phosphate acyltransferase